METEAQRKAGQFKRDTGKTPVFQGLFRYFPRALLAVASVSQHGFEKYQEWGGWKKLQDAKNRYDNAFGRHVLEEGKGHTVDESAHLIAAHTAWNALARLELMLMEMEQGHQEPLPAQEPPKTIVNRYTFDRGEQMDPVDYPTKEEIWQ